MSDIVLLNGEFVDRDRARVSVFDRGFLYGDGLFETARVCQGRPFAWTPHWRRFVNGASVLGLRCDRDEACWRDWAEKLIGLNGVKEGFLRWGMSRGEGPRGYSPRGADVPTLVMSTGVLPPPPPDGPLQWRAVTSTLQLPPASRLSACKHANKLLQVLARAEADAAGVDEALLTGLDGSVAEATSGNVAWVRGRTLCVPPPSAGCLPGVTQEVVQGLMTSLGWTVVQEGLRPDGLDRADGVVLLLSTHGVVELVELDGRPLRSGPGTRSVWQEFRGRMVAGLP